MSAVVAQRRVGRFELRRILGRGAQATVWLGYDARLDREVAVKLFDPAQVDAVELNQWLHEARAVSRLTHPNVVPVFEADNVDGQPYLVFELVDGKTLSAVRREKGAFGARQAVGLMLEVLDALAAAHEQGIVHRDLKPSNVLIGSDGRARVMDFGIAARADHGGDGRVVGTPGYMSPEAARGEIPAPAMDVFAAGMLLGELLLGKPLIVERDPYRAIERVQEEDFVLPAQARVDDTLRAIVARAVARKAEQRYDGARSMHQALTAWLNPEPAPSTDPGEGKGTLDFLLRRMRHKRDFPALSQSIVRVQRLAISDTETVAGLSAEILKDVALTNKLLRMVNTVHFSQAGAGQIGTVSRAVSLVGFAGIRNMALSVVLLEHMQDKQQASQMREEFLRALMAGTLAVEMSASVRQAEEAFIGAMFQNLGRMLTEYYFPDEAQQIRQLARRHEVDASKQEAAAQQVLGLSFQDLGQGVAKSWGLPEGLVLSMKTPPGTPPAREIAGAADHLRWIGRAANEAADAMLVSEPDALATKLGRLAETYGPSLGLQPKQFIAAAAGARHRMTQLAQGLGLQVAAGEPARRLLDAPVVGVPTPPAEAPDSVDATTPAAAATPSPEPRAAAAAAARRPDGIERLSAGIQQVTELLAADDVRLNEVLKTVLDSMFEALRFQRVVLCLRDVKLDAMTGRFGVGHEAVAVSRAIRIPLAPGSPTDVFTAVCSKVLDMQIDDASAPHVARRLPAWFRKSVDAPCFLLLPMKMRDKAFGLIYADRAGSGPLGLSPQELSMLRTLRSQVVMAFKQADRG